MLWNSPAFTLGALAALALGIGANTAIFSVVNAVLLKPLTYPEPHKIVELFVSTPQGPAYGASVTKYNLWRHQSGAFQDVAAYEYAGVGLNLTTGGRPEQVHAIHVTSAYFRLFGAPVVSGRVFTSDEDRPRGDHVIVLSYGLWQSRFGGDAHIAGTSLILSGTQYRIVGVLGPEFNSELDSPPDVFLPFQLDPNSIDHAQYFVAVARLKPHVTPLMANAQLQVATAEFRRSYPNIMGPQDSFRVQPFQDALVSDVRSSLLVLAGAVGFVLLIACANVANLSLVRATVRRREMALRAALGAGRGRIIRQMLTESVVLSTLGGALGLGLGIVGVRTLMAINAAGLPRIGEHGSAIAIDWRVLIYSVLISLASGIIFGLIPASEVSRTDLTLALNEGGRSGAGRRQNRTRSLLVITEVALALVLTIGAALLVRSFFALRAVDAGFSAHNVLTMRMSLAGSRYWTTAEVTQLVLDALRRVEAVPGIAVAAASYSLPLEGGFGIPFNVLGRPPSNGKYDGRGWIGVSPGYFDVFEIPVLRGRGFDLRDAAGAGLVAIINQAMARRFWPERNPIGEQLMLGQGYGPEFQEPARQIVGVVGDVHDLGLNANPSPMVYVPLAQVTDGITALTSTAIPLTWIVRTLPPPRTLDNAIQDQLVKASGGMPLARVRTMHEVVSQSTSRSDFNLLLLAIFAGAALLLAAIGIYGVMTYSVQQREQEISIRFALGAEAETVRNMILVQGMRLAGTGIILGVAASFALSRLLASSLFGVKAWDPLVFATVPCLLAAIGAVSAWLPARRAAQIRPVR